VRSSRKAKETRIDDVAKGALLLFEVIVAARSRSAVRDHLRMADYAAGIFRAVGWRLLEAESLEYAGPANKAAEIYASVGIVLEVKRLRAGLFLRKDDSNRQLTRRQRDVCTFARRCMSNHAISNN
jgi:hypothetical protein